MRKVIFDQFFTTMKDAKEFRKACGLPEYGMTMTLVDIKPETPKRHGKYVPIAERNFTKGVDK